MNVKRVFENNAILISVAAFVIGLLVGWMLLGWVVAPVQYVDAGPSNLSDFFKVQYVQLVADSFALTGDVQKAEERLSYLGGNAAAAVDLALQNSTGIDSLRVSALAAIVPAGPAESGTGGGAPSGGLFSLLRAILPICAVGVLLLVAVGGGLLIFRMRKQAAPSEPGPQPGSMAGVSSAAAAATPREVVEGEEVSTEGSVGNFKTTYMLGNDLYDESFSIDDANGEFLGECGVGISETIGVGDPKKVTAFEVWLFDKNDIKTVTKVVMSEHAYHDEALKSRLAPKGDLVLARTGEVVKLETKELKVEARIVDLQYGTGVLPTNSFFQQLTFAISAWRKPPSPPEE